MGIKKGFPPLAHQASTGNPLIFSIKKASSPFKTWASSS